MDFSFTEAQLSLRHEFDDFFSKEMKHAPPPYGYGGLEGIFGTEEGFQFHRHMAKKLGKKGWIARAWPKAYGGMDAPLIEQLIFNEVVGYHRGAGIDIQGIGMFAPTLLVGASEEQKIRLLPPLAGGEAFYCQGWSEPDAGSDLANIKTLALCDGDHYVINGQKCWCSGAHRADHMFMLARTDPDSYKNKGLSVFNLRMDLPGIDVRPVKYMNNRHVFNDVFFTDVRVPACDLIGKKNDGWNLTRQTMNFERSNSGKFLSIKRTLHELMAYSKTTCRDGAPLSQNPIIRKKLARLFADAEAGHALAQRVFWDQSQKRIAGAVTNASASKVLSSELAQRTFNFATEMMGLYGQVEDSAWAPMNGLMVQYFQFSPAANIAAGTNEIQRDLIAWTGLGLPRIKYSGGPEVKKPL
jgi:3-oxocholest-4-en-26-oyl-CoA dehydrogenase alpha subunit